MKYSPMALRKGLKLSQFLSKVVMGASFLSLGNPPLGLLSPCSLIMMSDSGSLGGLGDFSGFGSGSGSFGSGSGIDSNSGVGSFWGLVSDLLVPSGLLNLLLPPDELASPNFPLEVVVVATVLIGGGLGNCKPLSDFLGCLGLK